MVQQVVARTQDDGTVAKELFSPENLKHNTLVLMNCRTYGAIVAGVVAGILGLTNLWGPVCYFAVMALVSVLLLKDSGYKGQKYFPSWKNLVFGNLTAQLSTFILFWTLAYDVVHIF